MNFRSSTIRGLRLTPSDLLLFPLLKGWIRIWSLLFCRFKFIPSFVKQAGYAVLGLGTAASVIGESVLLAE